jgi:hypothetical protein
VRNIDAQQGIFFIDEHSMIRDEERYEMLAV